VRLILIRHGESVGNAEGRLQGQADYDLTERGREQARLAGRRLAAEGVRALYASPLRRAFATGEAIGRETGLAPIALPGVREYDFGELAGATYAELRQRFAAAGAASQPAQRVYPGEEGREAFLSRVTQSLWDVIERHAGETTAVVAHGGPIALFCQSVLGLPYRRPMPFAIDNCSFCVIDVVEGGPADGPGRPRAVLTALNDACHLQGL
jgi:broad specificity phosphatase PhoE